MWSGYARGASGGVRQLAQETCPGFRQRGRDPQPRHPLEVLHVSGYELQFVTEGGRGDLKVRVG